MAAITIEEAIQILSESTKPYIMVGMYTSYDVKFCVPVERYTFIACLAALASKSRIYVTTDIETHDIYVKGWRNG